MMSSTEPSALSLASLGPHSALLSLHLADGLSVRAGPPMSSAGWASQTLIRSEVHAVPIVKLPGQ